MKKGTIFTIIFRIMGIIVLILGIRMIGEGIYNYIDEHNQKDWISTTAYVIDISSEYSGTHHNRHVNYDITYQYEVDGNKYFDMLYNRSKAMELGDKIKIKYNPSAPENSTDILAPNIKNLVLFLAFGTIFITIGFFLSGTWALTCKIRHKGEMKENEILPPKEHINSNKTYKNSQNLALRILVVLIFLGGTFLLIKLFPGIRPIKTDQFIEIVDAAGYTANDTSTTLSQNWKVGSMLKEAYSFNDDNIKMDFAVMDTTKSANVLFNSMTLPISNEDIKESHGIVHEFYLVENKTLYIAKIRISNTVLYVSEQVKYKPEAEKLLKEFGYWKE